MELRSERLHMRHITLDDWPLFLALHTDQLVTQYVCETQSESQTRENLNPDCHSGYPVPSTGYAL